MARGVGPEQYYMRNTRKNIYVALEDLGDDEWLWDEVEIKFFKKLWREGLRLCDIASKLKRTETAVLLLSLDQLAKGFIRPREEWQIR